MKIIWHDATILNGEFNVDLQELKLFIEFNANLEMKSDSASDEFITVCCVFKHAKVTPITLEFLDKLSQDEHVFADVISCTSEEINDFTTTVLNVSLTDCINHTNDYINIEINSEPYEFQTIE